jgi:hypothetical protein
MTRDRWIRLLGLALVASPLLPLAGSTVLAAKKPLTGIPLEWRPTEQGKAAHVNPGAVRASVRFGSFVDNRERPELVGEGREEEDEGKVYPVTTSTNVAEWCRSQMADRFREWGVSVVGDAEDLVVEAEIVQLFVMERNRYVGNARLKVSLLGNDGSLKWSGFAIGTNSRFGRTYKAENYHETLSDSLLMATINLISDAGFQAALKDVR